MLSEAVVQEECWMRLRHCLESVIYGPYDGEPAMKLESAANKSTHVVDLPVVFKKEKNSGVPMLDTTELLLGVYELSGNTPRLILLLRLRKVLQRESQNLLCRLPQKGDLKR